MWITNQDLSLQIQALSKRLEKFEQAEEPVYWRYEWQTWYNKVDEVMEVWDWQVFKPIGWSSWWWIADTKYSLIDWRSITVWWDTTFSWFWFEPKKVMIFWTNTVWLWYYDDDWNKTNVTTTLTWSNALLIHLESGWLVISWHLKEFTTDWFIVTWDVVDNLTAGLYATCFSNI